MANGTTNTNTSGEASVSFDFVKKGDADCISDKNMSEIIRRLVGSVKGDETGDVVFSVNPPNDKKKLWIEISSAGGIIGTVKRFDSSTGEWVDDHTELPDVNLKDFTDTKTIASDDDTVVLNHNFGTGDYLYQVIFTTDSSGDGRWREVNKDINSLELKFLGASGAVVRIVIWEVTF